MPRPTNPEWIKKYPDYVASQPEMPAITNRMFAGGDKDFVAACELAGVKPTAAQARKYRHGRGSAYTAKKAEQQAQALAN